MKKVLYRGEKLEVWGEEGEDEGEDGVAHAVEGGGRELVVVAHVVPVSLRLQLERLGQDFAWKIS